MIRRIGVICALVLIQLIGYSQISNLEFKHLTTTDGLSQSSVIAMAQDHQGMLWIGTRDGLNRYDGRKITIFRNESNNPNSISNNDILDIAVDGQGNLWIGTYSGLNFYDLRSEKFTQYLEHVADSNSLSNSTIWSIDVVSPDQIFIGTSDGLNVLNPLTGAIDQYFHEKGDPKTLTNNGIRSIYTDTRQQTWIGTENGLNRLVMNLDETLAFELIALPTISPDQPVFVQCIQETDKGVIWVGTKANGLYALNSEGSVIDHYQRSNSRKGISNNNIRAMAVDHQNTLWIGTYNGLNRMDSTGRIEKSLHIPMSKNSLSENKVKSLFCSDNGSIWVGTYYGGVNMWNPSNFNFSNYKAQVGGFGLSYNVVSSIVESHKEVYFGTEGKGLSILNKTTHLFGNITKEESGLTDTNIKGLRMNESGDLLWICTFDAGLKTFKTSTRKVITTLNMESGLSSNSVYDIIVYDKNLWMIGTFGGGLNLYNPKNGKVVHIKNNPTKKASLSDDQVRSMMLDSQGNVWVGTQKGLNFLSAADIANRTFRFKHYFRDMKSESGEDIRIMFESSDHRIWVGSKQTGLHVLEYQEFKAIDLFSGHRNTSNAIHAIEEDSQGHLWISSNNGIIKYDPRTNTKKLFEASDGLVSNEFNSNSSLRSRNGTMYFGGPDGVSWFHPNLLRENTYAPKVGLIELKINSQIVKADDGSEILNQAILHTREIELAYDQSNFTLNFALPSYINPEKNTFLYRLKGLEENWTTTSVPQVSYIIQNSGNYTFEVKGVNNDGYESEFITVLEIRVNPAPWRSAWAFVFYALIIGIALISLYRMVKSQAQLKYELDLEHKTNLQQEELNHLKLQFFTNISHEFRTPLTLILGPLDQIIEEFRGSSVLFKKLKIMQQSTNQLLKLINQLMDFRKIENQQDQLKAAEGDLVKFVYEIYLSFKFFAKNGNYEYTFESENDEISIYFDRDKLERVVYNLISNAFKYTPEGGQVTVKLREDNDIAQVLILDNGEGIAKDKLTRIFERFYQVETNQQKKEGNTGTGIGLALAKGLVDLHLGKIEVKSEVGVGSNFSVSFLKGSGHLQSDQIIDNFLDSEHLDNYIVQPEEKLNTTIDLGILPKTQERQMILVVEDNDQVRNFILGLLAPYYNLLEANDGEKGNVLAKKEIPDLIISDVMMPNMDGIEFCSIVKSNLKTSHIPFILLTARTSLIFKYEGLESGADDYINKPFNVKELSLKVRNLLRFVSNLKEKFKQEKQISPSEITISSIDEELLERAIQIVDENIENQFLDVNLFAKELGVSRTMLFTKVKAWTNMTPNEFVLSMRMKRAAQLLEQGKLSITQITYKVGFKDPKYFSRSFNKYYSLSPSDYSKKFN